MIPGLRQYYNENIVTIKDYNVPIFDHFPGLASMSYWDFQKTPLFFDCIVTYSSVEHSGLGRYGDPLDPEGDINVMQDIINHLVENGLCIWGAPVGHDAVVWNAHRIYGKIRLPLMFDGFEELDWFGGKKKDLLELPLSEINFGQPVVVLQKQKNYLDFKVR
jgi:hypothetical protein